MRGLNGKVFIVTGGGSGIGAATVLRLLAEGARVVAGDINEAGLRATSEQAATDRLAVVAFDLADETSIRELVGNTITAFGQIDGVANVAADVSNPTMARDVNVGSFDPQLWHHVINANLIGTATIIREALPHILKQGGGSIVNTSSAAAWLGEDVRPAYAASKIGLHALTRHTARAWGKQGVRCNAVAPGLVLSETAAALMPQEYQDAVLDKGCSTRLGVPEDLAASITFLLSDDAAWVNGQIWSIDGGMLLRE
jgi:NAD(P)-dependent dehydrogenase (short-subunit alcohol dehydrogenase family)